MSLFSNRVGIRYSLVILFVLPLNGFLLTPSPKFSSHFLIQPPYLGLLEGAIKDDDRLYFSMARLEASRVCSLAWILSPESIPPTIDTRYGFSFPSISVISSSTLLHLHPSLLSFGVFGFSGWRQVLPFLFKLFLGSWWEAGGYTSCVNLQPCLHFQYKCQCRR